MPSRGRPATSSGYQYCDHCNKTLHRSVVWRHKHSIAAAAALDAIIDIPPAPEHPPAPPASAPSSPQAVGDISITSTEQALSDVHYSDLSEDDAALLQNAWRPNNAHPDSEPDDAVQELSLMYDSMQLEEEGGLIQGDDDHNLEVDDEAGEPVDDLSEHNSMSAGDPEELLAAEGTNYGDGMDYEERTDYEERMDYEERTDYEDRIDYEERMGCEAGMGYDEADIAMGFGDHDTRVLNDGWELRWGGLPGGAEGNAVLDGEDGDRETAAIPPAGDEYAISNSSRSSTPPLPNHIPPCSRAQAAASPLPDMVRIWDLQAARHRVAEGIPPESDVWNSIKMFKLQMEVNLGANAYQKFRATFSNLELPSLKSLREEMYDLCGIKPELYDCCKNSCLCFVGPYAALVKCTYCHHDRYKPDGQPFNQFHYLPLVPQIKALYAGKASATAMRHRSIHEFDNWFEDDRPITDIYDSDLYRQLKESRIEVNGHVLPDYYLADPRDVLLTGLTDGFQVFSRGKHTAWPLLFINNNLSPLERYQTGNCICTGLIPGPQKPKDHDSFTFIVVQELVKAAVGTDCYDAFADEMFRLRIFCPWKCGDLPAAASAYTGGKHHGAQHPCRMCPIEGIRIINSTNLSHYIPITRPPGYPPSSFTLETLPLRTHSEWIQQAKAVDEAPTQTARQALSQLYGINHTAITSKIPGLQFPWSIPYEFMHLLENTIKNYVGLISGNFKDIGQGVESYAIPKAIWKEIGLATVLSNNTIPSAFGRRISNIAEDRTYFTAESYLVWTTMYSRILLRGRFPQERYYDHWCLFVSIIERCLDLSSTATERNQLREDIHKWYSEYEKIFYQYRAERLVTCLLTIHAWIHIPDIIEKSGPLWAYWSWVMERFCGQLSRAVSSRKWPYSSLNRRILEIGTLHAIRHMYSLEDRLPHYTAMYNPKAFHSYHNEAEYPEITLLHPCKVISLQSEDFLPLQRRIVKYLITQYDISSATANQCIPDQVKQWGRIRIKDADTINSIYGYTRKEENHRDRSFIQYELLIDLQAHRRRADPVFQPTTFFGQLERVLTCKLKPTDGFACPPHPLVLMDVHMSDAHQDRHGFWEYDKFRYREIVNGTSIRALVGRIRDRGKWVFVQRSGAIEHASFVD